MHTTTLLFGAILPLWVAGRPGHLEERFPQAGAIMEFDCAVIPG
jgi:hypothetical protein